MPYRFHLLAACVVLGPPAYSQQRTVTAADYARAEKFLGYNTTPLMSGVTGRVTWLPGDRFWYRNTTAAGMEFILIDAAGGSRRPVFDHAKIAAGLGSCDGGR